MEIKNLSYAKDTFSKGFPRIAKNLTTELRKKIKINKDECDLLLAIDSSLKDVSNMKLNAEKCLYSGQIDNPNPYLAISVAFEIEGNQDLAQKVLLSAIEKVNHHESFYRQLAQINYKQDKKENAQKILLGLVKKNPENERMIRESIQFFTKRNEWESAYTFISALEKIETINFESQITLYGVAKKNKDEKRAQKYLTKVNQVLEKLPKEKALMIRAQLEKI